MRHFRNPSVPIRQRKRMRLQGWDYASPGPYFVTTNTFQRVNLLTDIDDGRIVPNDVSEMVNRWERALETRYTGLVSHAFVCMPDHIHALWELPDQRDLPDEQRFTLCDVVGWLKSRIANAYIEGVHQDGWPPFDGHLWQRSYWETIIRDNNHFDNVHRYIRNNPVVWERRHRVAA